LSPRNSLLALVLLPGLMAGNALAQSFPNDGAYRPWPCAGGVMTDRVGDTPGAVGDADLVGVSSDPTGLRAADGQFLYFRLRLNDDPRPGGTLAGHAWGIEIDTDNDPSTYEILVDASGVAAGTGDVFLWRNTAVTVADSPADPADAQPLRTYPFAQNARITQAPTSEGGSRDFFIDVAVPWSDLSAAGMGRNMPVRVWAGTSTAADALNLDIACHDGASGPPRLSGISPARTVADPVLDSDADGVPDAVEVQAGTDPNDPNSRPAAGGRTLEGGPGCSTGGGRGDPGPAALIAAALAGWLLRRARRRAGHRDV